MIDVDTISTVPQDTSMEMSSEPMVYKRREPDDGSQESQQEGGKESESADQKLDQSERNKKLRRDVEVWNLNSNISYVVSSRVWLEEELTKVVSTSRITRDYRHTLVNTHNLT